MLAARRRSGVETRSKNAASKTLVAVEMDVELPDGFPERYREAVVRAADTCKVKRAIEAQPRFVVRAVPATRGS